MKGGSSFNIERRTHFVGFLARAYDIFSAFTGFIQVIGLFY